MKGYDKMNKTLVAYFSATGTTEKVAKVIATNINADIFEIIPKEKYTNSDLNWNDANSRTTHEKENLNIRPEIASKLENIDDYNVIFLGFPVWWYKAPNIIYTFLESYNFTNKTIIPFCTSGGTGISETVNYLKNDFPNLKFKSGKRISGYIDKEEIINWVNN